jgi:hypothetical protein
MSERDEDMDASLSATAFDEASSMQGSDRSPKSSQTRKAERPVATRDTTYYCDSVVLQVRMLLF